MDQRPKHLVLAIEIPTFYVADVEELRNELGLSPGETESDFILNTIGEPDIVKLTTEISGEKDSDVVTVWGSVRGASLEEASKGYGENPHLTEEELEKHGSNLEPDAEEAIRDAVDRLRAIDGVSDADVIDALGWHLRRLERKAAG